MYVCMLVQRFEPQGRRFTNFHYYYHIVTEFCQTGRSQSPSFLLLLSLKWILQFHSSLVFTLAAK